MPSEDVLGEGRFGLGADKARLSRADRLLALAHIVHSTLDLQKLFYRAALAIHELLPCDRVHLSLRSSEQESWEGFALEMLAAPRWENVSARQILESAVPVAFGRDGVYKIDHLTADTEFAGEARLGEQGFRSLVHVPLACREQHLGVLTVVSRRENTQWDDDLLGQIAKVLAAALDNVFAYRQIRALQKQLARENRFLRDEIQTGPVSWDLLGNSLAMHSVREAIQQVAPTDSTVLITGETGTGKELVARALHEHSFRRKQLLVNVNCAALGQSVLTSELFGHEIGAFTGAVRRRIGRFEMADKGTIFLDEIAEMPAETQVILLRVLQERVIERVGGNEAIPVDVRVITATNRDLPTAVAEGKFREDLFYRLNVFPIEVPPLRDRLDDLPLLVDHFLRHLERKMDKQFSPVSDIVVERLKQYPWPGNVRELQHVLERAVIVNPGPDLEIDPSWLPAAASTQPRAPVSLAETERGNIVQVLNQCGGKIYGPGGAAEVLGLKPTTLYGKMRKHNIERKPDSRMFQ